MNLLRLSTFAMMGLMISGIVLLTVMAFIGIISYRRPRLEQRVIKNIPLIDWFYLLILPVITYFAIILLVNNILSRNKELILDYNEFFLIAVGIIFMIYAFVGNSIHFVSKVLSRYLLFNKKSMAYYVNETFHGKLSHYLSFVCTLIVVFLLAFMEINYPLKVNLNWGTDILIMIASLIAGVSFSKGIFYTSGWFGGYNKPLFFLVSFLVIILFTIFKAYQLNLIFYPINLFVLVMFLSFLATFVFRQILIFTRLGKKRRLQFLVKLLSL